MGDNRIDPDILLKRIKEEEDANGNYGRLKIFFGYAAGVGKTYAMLDAAHVVKSRGVDVVIGYVEPHTRPETMELVQGLESISSLSIEHKGIKLNEFDLDGAMKRKPELILIDELAHTNGQGCRHEKRYQDILELLKAGVDVYTTVNVQHIESLNDMVAAITGIMVRERIPDKIFDDADQVELIDIEPEELIERLKAGKIYKEAQTKEALGNFFSIENLVALREIALRRCADRVNIISEKKRIAQGSSYFTDEHILVCLSSAPTNAKIIRTAARMANAFKGAFTALFVETPAFDIMSSENKKKLQSNIALARQLGAKIETVYGEDVAFQIGEFARLSGVSKIVIGRNKAKKRRIFGKTSLTEQITAVAPNIDVYIIPDKYTEEYKPEKIRQSQFKFVFSDVLKSVGLLAMATAIGYAFSFLGFSEANIITIYILSVLVTAIITTHRVYSLSSSIISVLTFNFCFTDPRFSFNAYDSGYPFTFFIMFVSAFITSTLAVRINQNAKQSARTAYRTKLLLETNQLLQKATNKKEIITIAANQLTKLVGRDIIVYLVEDDDLGKPYVFQGGQAEFKDSCISENERAVATWVFKNNKHAGATTDTLSSAKCLYLAIRVNEIVYGVVGIAFYEEPFDSFEDSIVLSILGECGLALEIEHVWESREEAAILAKNEQLRANLLRSISHDLRTPLTSISGNAGILLSSEDSIDKEKRKVLYEDIYDDSLWLINLVENLLSVTRIEDGSMHLKMTAELMEEIIAEALHHINRRSVEHKITVRQTDDFIMAKMDARLIVQVVINLVDNAIKYTPPESEIVIDTSKKDGMVVVKVSDNGGGISDESKARIFDMFYTATTEIVDSRRSLGLGLALCKSIIAAHDGAIIVKDNIPQGTCFEFTLPAEEVILHE
ncbi:MAG: sensor histidine kinase KdpD [Anaerovoracaceae bacterium]